MCRSSMSRLGNTWPQLQVSCCCPASILPRAVPPRSRGMAVGVAAEAAAAGVAEACAVIMEAEEDVGRADGGGAESGGGRGSSRGDGPTTTRVAGESEIDTRRMSVKLFYVHEGHALRGYRGLFSPVKFPAPPALPST